MSYLRMATVLILCVLLTGGSCSTSPGQLAAWRENATVLREEIQQSRQDLVLIENPGDRAALEAKIAWLERQAVRFEQLLNEAETDDEAKWSVAEGVVGAVAGFFPPALLALPFIRTLKRRQEAIFTSVRAGGGVVNPDAAKSGLMENLGAYKDFKRWKKRNGHEH